MTTKNLKHGVSTFFLFLISLYSNAFAYRRHIRPVSSVYYPVTPYVTQHQRRETNIHSPEMNIALTFDVILSNRVASLSTAVVPKYVRESNLFGIVDGGVLPRDNFSFGRIGLGHRWRIAPRRVTGIHGVFEYQMWDESTYQTKSIYKENYIVDEQERIGERKINDIARFILGMEFFSAFMDLTIQGYHETGSHYREQYYGNFFQQAHKGTGSITKATIFLNNYFDFLARASVLANHCAEHTRLNRRVFFCDWSLKTGLAWKFYQPYSQQNFSQTIGRIHLLLCLNQFKDYTFEFGISFRNEAPVHNFGLKLVQPTDMYIAHHTHWTSRRRGEKTRVLLTKIHEALPSSGKQTYYIF